jgi:DNA polymerase (family 10)
MDSQLLHLLNETATLLELANDNPFKIRAFQNAVRALETSTIDLAAAFESGTLESALGQLRGVGKGLHDVIREYMQTGSFSLLEELRMRVPESVVAMTHLRGLGAKKVRTLWTELGITSVAELEAACQAGRVAALKGFGEKTQANIVEAIAQWRTAQEAFHLHTAFADAEHLLTLVRACPSVERAEFTGELRRYCEVITRIELLAQTHCFDAAVQELLQVFPSAKHTITNSDVQTFAINSERGIPTTLLLVSEAEFVQQWHRTSASEEYNQAFTAFVNTQVPALQNLQALHDEESLYKAYHLPCVPPELRESAAMVNTVLYKTQNGGEKRGFENLITKTAIRGALHVHSTWSDGKHSIRQMAEAASALGFEYIAICDHSKSAAYANGLSEERIKRQHEEIDALNEEFAAQAAANTCPNNYHSTHSAVEGTLPVPIRILKGIESDILYDGSLDYADSVLETFDVVVASVHSRFTMSREAMTERIIRAMQHPCTTIIGHPTGRLLLRRKEYAIHIEEVIAAAAEYGTVLELNANPYRLDLSWRNCIIARNQGVRIAINTDAHAQEDLQYIRFGVGLARKAGLCNHDVVNTLAFEAFTNKYVKSFKHHC